MKPLEDPPMVFLVTVEVEGSVETTAVLDAYSQFFCGKVEILANNRVQGEIDVARDSVVIRNKFQGMKGVNGVEMVRRVRRW